MSEQERTIFGTSLESMAGVYDLIGRLFRVAEPGAVYSEPVVSGDRTVIITSELTMSIGAGGGFGTSSEPTANTGTAGTEAVVGADAAPATHKEDAGGGGGGGGGGFSFGRPVAAVIIEPSGVRVEPIVDPTKLGIALFTTLGAMFFAWTSLRRTTTQLAARQLAADTRAAARLARDAKRATSRSSKEAAKAAAREAKLAAQLAAKEAGQQARHAAEAASLEAKKAAADMAKDAAKLATKQAVKQARKQVAKQFA